MNNSCLSEVQSLLAHQQFNLACWAMLAVVEGDPDDDEAWFLYAACLNEAGRVSEAVNAALKSWLVSGQRNSHAVHMAIDLLPTVGKTEEDIDMSVSAKPTDVVIALLRNQMREELDLGKSDNCDGAA